MRHSVPPGESQRLRSAISFIHARNGASQSTSQRAWYMAPPAPAGSVVPSALASAAILRTAVA
eukprot:978768-Lingulodinium_polyedra.AAC.1